MLLRQDRMRTPARTKQGVWTPPDGGAEDGTALASPVPVMTRYAFQEGPSGVLWRVSGAFEDEVTLPDYNATETPKTAETLADPTLDLFVDLDPSL